MDRAAVEDCLAGAKIDTAAGPVVSGSRAIGVRLPGGGGIDPGNFSAAIFVEGSEAEAKREVTALSNAFGPQVAQAANLVVLYDADIPADAGSKIARCTHTEAPSGAGGTETKATTRPGAMPDLVGEELIAAEDRLKAADHFVDEVKDTAGTAINEYSTGDYEVCASSPAAGSPLPPQETPVELTVAKPGHCP